jgi:hypothetical protein
MKFNLYSFHKGIADHRFDHNNTIALINALTEKGYEINHLEYSGSDGFVYHGVTINQGSILIFEDAEHGTFKTYDFGDHPSLTVALSKSRKFVGAVIGQYNSAYWDSLITEQAIRDNIVGGPYPDSVWQLGINYDAVQEARSTMTLDKRLYWRGSLYASGVEPRYLGVRKALELLPNNLSESELYFGKGPLAFEQYLQESFQFRLALSIGGGGGALCGDLCFRDIEMFGLGIPLMRPKLIVENSEPLIPNFHYVAVDAEFDPEYRYANPEELSKRIANRYREVINDIEFLEFVKNNAKNWYENNISYPKITYNIIKLLNL